MPGFCGTGIEPKASCILGKHFNNWAAATALCHLSYLVPTPEVGNNIFTLPKRELGLAKTKPERLPPQCLDLKGLPLLNVPAVVEMGVSE